MNETLVGKKVVVLSNDFVPRDLVAHIIAVEIQESKILLRLDSPYECQNVVYNHIVASPRLSKDKFASLERESFLGCALVWIPNSKYDEKKPVNLSWWRGGGAAISDLRLS